MCSSSCCTCSCVLLSLLDHQLALKYSSCSSVKASRRPRRAGRATSTVARQTKQARLSTRIGATAGAAKYIFWVE